MNEAVRIWKNHFELLMKIRSKSERNALAFAMISYGFTGEIPSDLKLNQSNFILFEAIKNNFIAKKQGGREKQLANSSQTVSQSLSDNRYQITDNIQLQDKSSNCIDTQPKEKQIDIEEAIKAKKFVKPTIEEIDTYCRERKNSINAERFFDFYQSKGWKVGNQPMKDWRAAVRTWERSENARSGTNTTYDDEKCWSKSQKKESVWDYNMRKMKEIDQKLMAGGEDYDETALF